MVQRSAMQPVLAAIARHCHHCTAVWAQAGGGSARFGFEQKLLCALSSAIFTSPSTSMPRRLLLQQRSAALYE
jgi:hypothetical protein